MTEYILTIKVEGQSELQEAVEKATRLVELLQEAHKLIESLKG